MRAFFLCSVILIAMFFCCAAPASGSAQVSGETVYATWIMIWHDHNQAWWSADAPGSYRNLVGGSWKMLDWADNAQVEEYLDDIRNAGVKVVIADLTNGWGWLNDRCKYIQSLCAQKGMYFCVAENSGGNVAQFESHVKDIWNLLAAPDAPNSQAYFHYKGKPLIVCYAIRDWFKAYTASKGQFRSRFNLVWASGEDSEKDKWGWQLEPWVGTVPSKDSMFVTSSIRWNPGDGTMWRKSLAWLDYNFALAKKQHPRYIIVGSYDDPSERNAWLVAHTYRCDPGRQMRDKTGRISSTAYYERVKDWIAGSPRMEPGGCLPDGPYRISNRERAGELRMAGVQGQKYAETGAAPGAELVLSEPGKSLNGIFWLYHLGNNRYRIIALHSGLALEPDQDSGRIIQDWDSPGNQQRWDLTRTSDGWYKLTNASTGMALAAGDSSTGGDIPSVQRQNGPDRAQEWRFEN